MYSFKLKDFMVVFNKMNRVQLAALIKGTFPFPVFRIACCSPRKGKMVKFKRKKCLHSVYKISLWNSLCQKIERKNLAG